MNPAIVALLTQIVPLIPVIIQKAENKWGPKKGPEKKNEVISEVTEVASKKIPGFTLDKEIIGAIIEGVLALMKKEDILDEAGKPTGAGPKIPMPIEISLSPELMTLLTNYSNRDVAIMKMLDEVKS